MNKIIALLLFLSNYKIFVHSEKPIILSVGFNETYINRLKLTINWQTTYPSTNLDRFIVFYNIKGIEQQIIYGFDTNPILSDIGFSFLYHLIQ